MSRLILCSDDFAFSREVSETIASLANARKINAVSCMAVMPGWPADSALLAGVPEHVQIGLHLTLTEEMSLTAMPQLAAGHRLPTINALSRMATRGRVPLEEVAAEIEAQFAAFMAALGRPPAFVDGHHHAHALPGIRELILSETVRRAPNAWIRDCTDRLSAILVRPFAGKAIGSAWHSRGLRRAAATFGLATNDSFAGHYDFATDYRALFPLFLRKPGKMHLVMCHPGSGTRAGDSIANARSHEAEVLRHWSIADMAAARGLAFPA
ncbi:MAG TPA: ChbG/HpnK family deacetylase [Sphingomicrobium sp.]|nr:ChbG/HpnK family deacetylase [Sphingomicrobium sp.]